MKKRYRLETGLDTSITLEIDADKITEHAAQEINDFWVEASYVLSMSDGDVFQAVARRAAGPLLGYLLDGYTAEGAVMQLSECEGWPDAAGGGITIVDHELPGFGFDDFDVTALEG